MNAKAKSTLLSYFGLRVKVVITMDGWSLIVYRGRKFVVQTNDLRSSELWDRSRALSQSSSRALALAS